MYHAKFYVFILLAFLLSACGSNEVENVEEENNPSANLKLKGKKWMWNSENISIGDDWIGVNKYITKVYFHSANEGVLYTSTRMITRILVQALIAELRISNMNCLEIILF